jgi:ssDNA-binding Zn-finger/Zn-ribbon topoisomerase 1
MEIKNNEEILFAIAVYGYAPEFWPSVAYRKAKEQSRKGEERQKEIKCPYCGQLLLTVSVNRRLDLIRFGKRERISCHEYRNCHKCHEKVGIIYLAG